MAHPLWLTKQWASASDAAIVKALFEPPRHIPPEDFAYIKRNRKEALEAYINILYLGDVPANVQAMLRQ